MVEFTHAHANLTVKEKPSYLVQQSSPGTTPAIFLGLLFPPLSVHKTSKLTRSKAAVPGGEHFPIYQQHIHEHSLI